MQSPAPELERYWATLTALEGSQSVIEEHFTEEDLTELADLLVFITGEEEIDITIQLEELPGRFQRPLRVRLERSGVVFDAPESVPTDSVTGDSAGCKQRDEGG